MTFSNIRVGLLLSVSIAVFLSNCSANKISKKEEQHYIINTNQVDSSAYYTILPYKQNMDKTMTEVIGFVETPLTKEQPEGNLGDFVCDLLFKQCKKYAGKDSSLINGVILNNGGLRTSIPEGNLTVGKVFELMPFDNELTLVEMTGEKTNDMLNYIAAAGGLPIAGIRMEISGGKAKNVIINGVPFDINKHYYFISSEYLTSGGDKMDFFKGAVKNTLLKKLIRDAILEYCRSEQKSGRKINVKIDGRISVS
jgi:2',3'-cyclic-nucleotide 2'-phosphodiesterase (5'-nucleotidase family)